MKRHYLILVSMAYLLVSVGIAFGAAAKLEPIPKGSPPQSLGQWQAKWNRLVTDGKKEGKVVLYGEVGPIFKNKVAEAFKQKFGIAVELVGGKSPEVAQKYLTERAANLSLADVLITGQTTTLAMLKPKNVLASPKPYLVLPEVLDAKAWPRGVLPFMDKDQQALALIAGYMKFVAVNTEQIKEGEVTSYADFLNPKWKGKMTLFDPSFPGNGGVWITFIMKSLGREAGERYLRQLALQDPVITRDARLQGETVVKGKYAIGIGVSIQVAQDLSRAGAPIAWNRMKEGGLVLPGAFVAALPDKAAHPAAAALMFNFLLSKEGQQIVSEAAGFPAMRHDLPVPPHLEEGMPKAGDKVYWLDEEMAVHQPTYYPLVREIFHLR